MSAASSLEARLRWLARAPVLLVASDYDGTMAQIVDDPAAARPRRESMAALRSLAGMAGTHAAIVSGRSLAALAEVTGSPEGVHLVGSHGGEFDLDFEGSLPAEAVGLRRELEAQLGAIASRFAGCAVEVKPASVALHYRNADPDAGRAALAEAEAGPGALPGVHAKHGKMVLELAVVPTSKGSALELLRRRVGATAVLFLGDDVTDEDAFRMLGPGDVSVKVGMNGATAARHRVADTGDVSRVLARLSELRAAWLRGPDATPIESHSLLSDQRSLALVDPRGRVVWLVAGRPDAAPLFSEIVGGPEAGFFAVAPVEGDGGAGQAYAEDAMVLRTEWPGVTVTDFFDVSRGASGGSVLVREVVGTGRVRVTLAPRPDFGRVLSAMEVAGRRVAVRCGAGDAALLSGAALPWVRRAQGRHEALTAEVDLAGHGGRMVLELVFGADAAGLPAVSADATARWWQTWAAALRVPVDPGLRPDLIRRSALVLRALCYAPSGAMVAAATTGLPECIGGVRNWDYRFCWPRDSALSASALARLGSVGEGVALLDWFAGVVERSGSADRLRPLYTVLGGVVPEETEVEGVRGYAGSRPVRVGNGARGQVQLDVFGPVVELAHVLHGRGATITPRHWAMVEAMVAAVATRWREPDHGIWEIRGPVRQHLHSKVMCWQTVALAADLAQRLHGARRPMWEALRDEIAGDAMSRGWSETRRMFTAAYGEAIPDAAVLHVGLSGMVSGGDARFAATVAAVEAMLRTGDTVHRYRMDDGLPGIEGGFNICTGWLIESYALLGRVDDARRLFDAYAAVAGPTGLMPEQFDPATGRGLGNFPQAFSHLALINAALRIASISSGA